MELVNKLFGSGAAALRDPRELGRAFVMSVGVPVVAFIIFLALWSVAASRIQTSLGAVPGPAQVAEQAVTLVQEHFSEREREAAFYERQIQRNKERIAEDPTYEPRNFQWTGKRTYLDQIVTSLYTVFVGFLLATVVAVPLGILAGKHTTWTSLVSVHLNNSITQKKSHVRETSFLYKNTHCVQTHTLCPITHTCCPTNLKCIS